MINYGEEIVALDKDTIEMIVKNKPRNKEETVALAKEHTYYFSNRHQDYYTLNSLVSSLFYSNYWYFWWD